MTFSLTHCCYTPFLDHGVYVCIIELVHYAIVACVHCIIVRVATYEIA